MSEKPIIFSSEMVKSILEGRKTQTRRVIKQQENHAIDNCPFGKPGDTLWVREKFLMHYPEDHSVLYVDDMEKAGFKQSEWCWKPSIHMPRWASRINLVIKSVRVERLWYISENDAIAEGATPSCVGDDLDYLKYRSGYMFLWDSINAKRGYGWDKNPWVWVIEFEVMK